MKNLPELQPQLDFPLCPQGMQHFVFLQTQLRVVSAKTSLLSENVHLLGESRYFKCPALCWEVLCAEHRWLQVSQEGDLRVAKVRDLPAR